MHLADKRTAKRRLKQLTEAKATGRVIALAHAGYLPTKVTFSDDSVSFYFNGNMDAYRRGMSSGRYPLNRTFHGRPPAIPSYAATSPLPDQGGGSLRIGLKYCNGTYVSG